MSAIFVLICHSLSLPPNGCPAQSDNHALPSTSTCSDHDVVHVSFFNVCEARRGVGNSHRMRLKIYPYVSTNFTNSSRNTLAYIFLQLRHGYWGQLRSSFGNPSEHISRLCSLEGHTLQRSDDLGPSTESDVPGPPSPSVARRNHTTCWEGRNGRFGHNVRGQSLH